MVYPKISIVTPVLNCKKYIEECINSILLQGYPNLEYIIVDGGSDDGTLEIIEKYRHLIDVLIIEKDNGIYSALKKGFSISTGSIMGWLNADDILHPNSLFSVSEILQLENVNWITGIPNVIDEKSRSVKVNDNGKWSKLRLHIEDTCIQQEGTFWNRSLWERSGAFISEEYQLAGDFELWNRFFDFEKLYNADILIGAFRLSVSGQLSSNSKLYSSEVEKIRKLSECEFKFRNLLMSYKYYKRIESRAKVLLDLFNSDFIQSKITFLHSYPQSIIFSRENQSFYLD